MHMYKFIFCNWPGTKIKLANRIDPNLDFLRWAQIILLRMFCVLQPYNCELKGLSASYADNAMMEYLSMEFLRSYANF